MFHCRGARVASFYNSCRSMLPKKLAWPRSHPHKKVHSRTQHGLLIIKMAFTTHGTIHKPNRWTFSVVWKLEIERLGNAKFHKDRSDHGSFFLELCFFFFSFFSFQQQLCSNQIALQPKDSKGTTAVVDLLNSGLQSDGTSSEITQTPPPTAVLFNQCWRYFSFWN